MVEIAIVSTGKSIRKTKINYQIIIIGLGNRELTKRGSGLEKTRIKKSTKKEKITKFWIINKQCKKSRGREFKFIIERKINI